LDGWGGVATGDGASGGAIDAEEDDPGCGVEERANAMRGWTECLGLRSEEMIFCIFVVSSSMSNEHWVGPGQFLGFAAIPNFRWYQQTGSLNGRLAMSCRSRCADGICLGSVDGLMPVDRFVAERFWFGW